MKRFRNLFLIFSLGLAVGALLMLCMYRGPVADLSVASVSVSRPVSTVTPAPVSRVLPTSAPNVARVSPTKTPSPTKVPVRASVITNRPAANTQAPAYQSYILNTSTHVFHKPSCASVKQMKESNKQSYYGPRQQVIDQGYKPCGRCHP